MKHVFVVFLVLTLTGCASMMPKGMVFNEPNDRVNLKNGSVCLMSLKTDNKFKPTWPPEVYGIAVTNEATNKKINISVHSLAMGDLLKKGFKDVGTFKYKSSSWEKLISFQLPSGSYRLASIRGGCTKSAGIIIAMASFDFPFDIPFQTFDEEYVYLGRIEMTNRERVSDDEIRSGNNLFTRLPQKQSGFGTGTFDVNIYDNFDQDIKDFRAKYFILKSQEINKRILSQWQKPNRN